MIEAFGSRLKRPEGDFQRFQVTAGVSAIRSEPKPDAEMLTQALGGDIVRLFREEGEFGLVQMERDGYVGWALMEALSAPVLPVTHRVSALRTYVFSEPSIKSAPRYMLCRGASLCVEGQEDRFLVAERAGFVVQEHARPVDAFDSEPHRVAETYLHTPYFWGGKESLGFDCSGLVQMAFAACGVSLPRDTDMQFALSGKPIEDWQKSGALRAGDLVFWKGHVGVMLDGKRLIHANAHHMATAIEPLSEAITRIASLYADPIGAKRIDVAKERGVTPDWLTAALEG